MKCNLFDIGRQQVGVKRRREVGAALMDQNDSDKMIQIYAQHPNSVTENGRRMPQLLLSNTISTYRNYAGVLAMISGDSAGHCESAHSILVRRSAQPVNK